MAKKKKKKKEGEKKTASKGSRAVTVDLLAKLKSVGRTAQVTICIKFDICPQPRIGEKC